MHRQIDNELHKRDTVEIEVDSRSINAEADESVASAMLRAGITEFRKTPVTDSPRGPFCMMGLCFECIVEIDGIWNQQACTTKVRDGMKIERHLNSHETIKAKTNIKVKKI